MGSCKELGGGPSRTHTRTWHSAIDFSDPLKLLHRQRREVSSAREVVVEVAQKAGY